MMEPLAEVRSYDDLLDALRARMASLCVSSETIDEVSGLPSRYVNKLLRPVPLKGLGPVSFGLVLGALAIKLVVFEDPEQLQKVASRLTPRSPYGRMPTAQMPTAKKRRKPSPLRGNSQWGKLMRARATLKQTAAKRSQLARHAAKRRWKKPRVVEVKQDARGTTS